MSAESMSDGADHVFVHSPGPFAGSSDHATSAARQAQVAAVNASHANIHSVQQPEQVQNAAAADTGDDRSSVPIEVQHDSLRRTPHISRRFGVTVERPVGGVVVEEPDEAPQRAPRGGLASWGGAAVAVTVFMVMAAAWWPPVTTNHNLVDSVGYGPPVLHEAQAGAVAGTWLGSMRQRCPRSGGPATVLPGWRLLLGFCRKRWPRYCRR